MHGSENRARKKEESPTAVALYRLYNPAAEDHLYTTDPLERDTVVAQGSYHSEGIAAWIVAERQPGTTPLYRLFDGTDHFYTASAEERDRALARGYRGEGVVGFVFSSSSPGTAPLHRLRHRQTGNHFYTVSEAEAQTARKKAGFLDDGIVGYVFTAPPASSQRSYGK